jgi:hypothetical protein
MKRRFPLALCLIALLTPGVATAAMPAAYVYNANHLYALNSQSGRLHVWTVTDKGAVEVSGSPYTVPFCGYLGPPIDSLACTQTLTVRSVP